MKTDCVTGKDRTDGGDWKPIEVAAESYNPGYSLETTLKAGYASKADMKQGYMSYGKGTGNKG